MQYTTKGEHASSCIHSTYDEAYTFLLEQKHVLRTDTFMVYTTSDMYMTLMLYNTCPGLTPLLCYSHYPCYIHVHATDEGTYSFAVSSNYRNPCLALCLLCSKVIGGIGQ